MQVRYYTALKTTGARFNIGAAVTDFLNYLLFYLVL